MHNMLAVLLLATAASKKPSIALTAAITPASIQHRDAIASNLSPSAKLKLHTIAASLQRSPAITDGTSHTAILSAFPGVNLGAADVETLTFVVLMDATQSAQQDLKTIADETAAINKQKEFLRQELSKRNALNNTPNVQKTQAVRAASVATLTVPPPLDANATVDQMKDRLDSLSELGEMESLRLQMAMDRVSKFMATLSNVEKKASDTASAITKNLK